MSFEVIVKKSINVPIHAAYQAFTDAEIWSKWFSQNTSVDLKKGGRFRNSDGDTGEYLDIVPNQLLIFTWEGHNSNSRVEVQFKQLETGSTEVSLRQYLLPRPEDADKMKTCWGWTLACLASFLETGRPVSMDEWKKTASAN